MQSAMQLAEKATSQQISPLTQRITFFAEFILKKQQKMKLESDNLYFVFAGKLVLGQRIIQETEFIVGKTGRQITALCTTSVLKLHIMRQRH